MMNLEARVEMLRARASELRKDAVEGMQTAFPKHPPSPGMAYSQNFARVLRDGRFAVQRKD